MTAGESLEKYVADSILERPQDYLEIDGERYPIAPPTPATLILISEQAATLPKMDGAGANIVAETISNARHAKALGMIAAILILGAKRVREGRKVEVATTRTERVFSWSKFRRVARETPHTVRRDETAHLAERIMEECSPALLLKVITRRLALMQLGDFFQLTASLGGANLTKATRGAVGTALGA